MVPLRGRFCFSVDVVRLLRTVVATLAMCVTLATGVSQAAPSHGPHLKDVKNAEQIVAVSTAGYGTSYATLRVYRKHSDGWHLVFGPFSARVGYNGFAPAGAKREGDGRTPSGSYRFTFMFGVAKNPGVHFRYRRALRTSFWDDDSSSANYNLWVDSRRGYPGANPEQMHFVPNYRYGAVIGYNLSRTPGRGSAIFFHVTDGKATLGCVSLPQSRLLRVLRWLRPSLHPRIIMGTRAAVYG